MARDLLKLGLMLAALAAVAILMTLFVSGYLTAFNSGAKKQTPGVSTGIYGGKSGKAALTSPTPKPGEFNSMMRRGGYPQYAQYPPSGPMIPVMSQPQEISLGSMPQIYQQPGLAPMVATPTAAPTQRPGVNSEIPVVPRSSYLETWYYLIQDLLGLFPRLFSGQYSAFPQWPHFWFKT